MFYAYLFHLFIEARNENKVINLGLKDVLNYVTVRLRVHEQSFLQLTRVVAITDE